MTVAHAEQVRLVHQHERERAGEPGQHLLQRVLEVAAVGAQLVAVLVHEQLADELAVGGEHAGQHAEVVGERFGVREVAVVAEREAGVGDRAVHGLGVAPRARAGGRVAHVADREMALERREPALVEDLGDQAHVLDDRDRLAVAHRDAGRLLAAVLERVEPEVRQMGDRLAGRIHAEDATGVLWAVQLGVQEKHYPMSIGRDSVQRPGRPRASRILRRDGRRASPVAGLLLVVHRPLGRRQEHDRRDRGRRAAGARPAGRAARRRRGARAPLEGPRLLQGRPRREHPPHRMGRLGAGAQRRGVGDGRDLPVPRCATRCGAGSTTLSRSTWRRRSKTARRAT